MKIKEDHGGGGGRAQAERREPRARARLLLPEAARGGGPLPAARGLGRDAALPPGDFDAPAPALSPLSPQFFSCPQQRRGRARYCQDPGSGRMDQGEVFSGEVLSSQFSFEFGGRRTSALSRQNLLSH